MKELECPNCGGVNPEIISEGKFRCKFCETLFVNEAMLQQKRAAEKHAAYAKNEELRQKTQLEQTRNVNRMSKRILLFVSIMLLIIFGFVGYMVKKSMDQSDKAREELIKSFQEMK